MINTRLFFVHYFIRVVKMDRKSEWFWMNNETKKWFFKKWKHKDAFVETRLFFLCMFSQLMDLYFVSKQGYHDHIPKFCVPFTSRWHLMFQTDKLLPTSVTSQIKNLCYKSGISKLPFTLRVPTRIEHKALLHVFFYVKIMCVVSRVLLILT